MPKIVGESRETGAQAIASDTIDPGKRPPTLERERYDDVREEKTVITACERMKPDEWQGVAERQWQGKEANAG